MNKHGRRLIVAALMSMSVYGGTYYWYKASATKFDKNVDTKPVAFVSTVKEDVTRRPASRLIWQMLDQGEPLYPGEAIKTSNKGEIRIQFAESDRYIDLDPDSLIVISMNKNEISLDLMDGSLFVAGGDGSSNSGNGPALTLNSAKGKVDLSKATASLSKSASGGVDLQVIKGSVKTDDGKELKGINQSAIQILSPQQDQPTIINPDNLEPVIFSWKGFPSNTVVSLWIGSSRKDLKEVAVTKTTNMSSLDRKLKSGKYFWKLVGKDSVTQKTIGESSLQRLEVAARYAPAIVAPEAESHQKLEKFPANVQFKWTRPEGIQNIHFELSKDESFKTKILSQNIEKEDSISQNLPAGDYYWRLSGNYQGLSKPVVGRVNKFSLSNQPEKPKVLLTWLDPNQGKPSYFVKEAKTNWAWTGEHLDQVKKWKLIVHQGEVNSRSPASEPLSTTEHVKPVADVTVPGAGVYTAVVEAYDEKGKLLAKTEYKTQETKVLPLLPSPEFEPKSGDLKANNDGKLPIQWEKVDGAKEYNLSLKDSTGKELRKSKFTSTSTALVNLLPGQYQIDIAAIDQYGRESVRKPARVVVVPEMSSLKAPKLKKVKVN
ncbi:MAG: hypothetical protein BroJett040_25970 [Oligoflexia bacterium]|nr:MAG: hypothetical protein BroJett040_25970 [Oligoflexia bacterium]